MRKVISLAIFGLALLLMPSLSQAVSLTSIDVEAAGCTNCFQVGPNQYAQAETFWNGASGLNGGLVLAAGQQIVFTQSGNTGTFFGFDFDTSESNGTKLFGITFNIGGLFSFSDPTVLGQTGKDIPASTSQNETNAWTHIGATTAVGGGLQIDVYVGYADNLHTDGCPGGNAPIQNCFPNPWDGKPVQGANGPTFFGNGAPSPITQGASGWAGVVDPIDTPCGGATDSVADCFDSGAIRIVVSNAPTTPEPSTLLLLGAGLVGLAGWGGRRYKNRK